MKHPHYYRKKPYNPIYIESKLYIWLYIIVTKSDLSEFFNNIIVTQGNGKIPIPFITFSHTRTEVLVNR